MGALLLIAIIIGTIIYMFVYVLRRIFSAFLSIGSKQKRFDVNENNEEDELLTFDILDEDE